MTSEIRTNSLKSRAGLSTVTFTDSGPMFSGITTFVDNSGFTVGTGSSIFSPSSNTITLGTNNAERLRITSAGDVVIGTTAAARSPLHIHRANADCYVHITNSTTGTGSGDGFTIHQSGVETLLNNRETGNMRLYTAGTERLRIDSSGRLLLGTTTEGHANGDDLTIATSGDTGITLRSGTSGAGNIYFSDATSGDGEYKGFISYGHNVDGLYFATNTSTRMFINSSGNVAIGNVSPQQLLHVWPDAANTTSAYVRVTAGDRNSNTGIDIGHDSSGNGHVNVVSNGTLSLSTNNNQRIKIANNSAATSIGGSNIFNAMLTTQGDVSGGLLMLKAAENTNRLFVSGSDSNGVEVNLYDEAGGQKGILGVSGTEFFIKAPNSSAPLTFYTHNGSSVGERMRIDSGGRLYTGASQTTLDTTAGTIHIDGGTSGGRIALRGTTTSAGGGLGEIFAYWNNTKVAGIIALAGADASNKDDGHLTFYTRPDSATGVQERLRIDSVGRLLVGTTTAMTTASNDHRDTIQAVDTSGAQLLLARNDTSTSVTNRLGEIAALTNDSGGAGYKVGASIRFEVSATQSSGDYPTAICFKTCTDGSDSLLERIRVNHDGNLLFTSSQIQKINDTSSIVLSGGDNSNVGGNISLYGSNHSSAQNIIRFRNSASEAMRINGDGDISVNRADNTSSNSILHISSHDVTTKYNNDNVAQVALLIDTHHSGTEALTSNRSKIGIRMDMEYSGTGTKTNTSGARNQLYGIHCSVDSTKDTYTSYGGYFYSNCVADNQAYSTISYGVYGYGRNYSIGGSNRSSTIAGGYFLGYRGGDINAGHCYGVYARAHNVNNTGDNTGDLTGVYAEAEMDKDATVNNAYAFRGYLDRDAGTITNSFILYGSHGGDSHFSNRWGIHISDSAKNYLGGNLTITGTFEKGTDNFRIPHPLVGLTTTKDLVHSVIEGPQMDLIYRGKVDLVGGTATINIDTKAGMTEGTFVVLCKDIQCFTSNETGWTAVKGSVTGNKITIIAQDNSCTDTISWMVVGERQDDNAKSSTCTDNDGNLIVEPDKRTDIIDKYQAESEKNEYNEDPD